MFMKNLVVLGLLISTRFTIVIFNHEQCPHLSFMFNDRCSKVCIPLCTFVTLNFFVLFQQLYLATGNPLTYEDEIPKDRTLLLDSVWNHSGEQLCVVCQYFPLSRALLPCRHTCICASCFSKLDTCPMCRSPIKSYFCIRTEEYLPESTNSTPSKPEPITQWLQERLTDFLGFHR